MCGIVAILSKNKYSIKKTINALKQLEYRGYDSSGIAFLDGDKLCVRKSVGRIVELEKKVDDYSVNLSIAHTRWATHGVANEINAHPHPACDKNIAVVHNGVIENYKVLKDKLIENGYKFESETDTEVISNLILFYYKEYLDVEKAFFSAINDLDGSYGIAMISTYSNKLFVAKNRSPLIFGIGSNEFYVASGLTAFSGLTDKIINLNDGEIGIIDSDSYQFYDLKHNKITKSVETVKICDLSADKGNFEHFMLKEIFEQPDVIERTIQEYIDVENKKIILPKFNFSLKDISFLNIIACGTSYYAGCVAKYFLEEFANVFVNVDIASEFRYRNTPLFDNGVSLFISQSGETADTIGALKYCKNSKNQKIISLINVVQSNIGNLSDVILKTVAGAEIGVASTKAFMAQISILYLFSIEVGKEKGLISDDKYKELLDSFINLPKVLRNILNNKVLINEISDLSKKLCKTNNLIYIGRDVLYPIALEGALKIKEISYIPTEGIATGELKHGPIALIDENSFVISLASSDILYDKTITNLEQILARNGKLVLICDDIAKNLFSGKEYKSLCFERIDNKFISVCQSTLMVQLLAYYTAVSKGNNVDKPRNLAKSVTVE